MERENVWLHYVKNIIAADVPSAVFLASYLRYANLSMNYVSAMEIIDLQKYKIIRQPNKLRAVLRSRIEVPFVFIIGKN